MTDRQRAILWLLFLFAVLATVAWFLASILATPAYACHKFSVWNYPFPQRCPVHIAQAAIVAPNPPSRPIYLEVPGDPDIDIPLPSLDTVFPPDCDAEWCQRLKGIGLLREKLGTN